MPIDRTTAPETKDFQLFELTPPRKFTLRNGIEETLFYNAQLELIHFVVALHTGILHETKKYLSSMCFALMKGAVQGKTAEEVNDFLDYYGVSLEVEQGMTTTEINISVPLRNCESVLPFIIHLLLHPVFEEDAVERQKQLSIKRLEYNLGKGSYRTTQLMFKTFFGEGTCRGTQLTRQHIEVLTTNELDDYYHRILQSKNVSLYVSGKVDDALQRIIETTFSQLPVGEAGLSSVRMLEGPVPSWVYEEKADSMQSSMTLCRRFIGYNHPDSHHFFVLSVLFGGYFGSRLMQNLRETNGYTYGVFDSTMFFNDQSIHYIDSEVNIDKTDLAVAACYDEMCRLQDEKPDDEEMALVRNYMLGSILRDVDGSIKLMKRYIYWQNFGLNEQEFYQMVEAIRTTDAETIQRLAQTYLQPEEFTTVVVGKSNR